MSQTLIARTIALRDEAWSAVSKSEAFAAFAALNNAVVSMGGANALAAPGEASARPEIVTFGKDSHTEAALRLNQRRRISQGDAAERVLREKGEPLPIGRLMEAVLATGQEIGGNQIANFRSALSKDKRFYSITRNSMFFWWLDGESLPPNWNEPAELTFDQGSAGSSSDTNQKGGGSHETATTRLASP